MSAQEDTILPVGRVVIVVDVVGSAVRPNVDVMVADVVDGFVVVVEANVGSIDRRVIVDTAVCAGPNF